MHSPRDIYYPTPKDFCFPEALKKNIEIIKIEYIELISAMPTVRTTVTRASDEFIKPSISNSYFTVLSNLTEEDLTFLKLLGVQLSQETRPGYWRAVTQAIKLGYIYVDNING